MKTPYLTQQKAIDETLSHLNAGKKKIINIQFCGLGKTELSAWISQNIRGNILFLVHKNSLVNQAYRTYEDLIKDRTFGFFNIDFKQNNKQIIFATVQTLCKDKNLSMFEKDYFELIVIDECHHMTANSYNKILKYFHNRYLLGFTATPNRTDRKSVLDLFEEKVGFFDEEGNDKSLRMGIELGYLSPLRYFGLNDNIDYSKISHKGINYKKGDLDKALIIDKRNDLIVKKYLELANGKKTIAFCNSIKHISSMKKHFEKYGIKAIGLNYKVGKNMQKTIEKKFRESSYDVILTVDLYIEGVNFPDCECVMFLRPTESERIFVQQLGRVMRRFNGKEFGMVLDFVGNQKNAYDRKKWIKKRLIDSKIGLNIPKDKKPLYYYDPLVEITIDEEIVDIFNHQKKVVSWNEETSKKELIEDYFRVKDILKTQNVSLRDRKKYGKFKSYEPYWSLWGNWTTFKEDIDSKSKWIDSAIDSYNKGKSVSIISQEMKLNRNYLSRIFKSRGIVLRKASFYTLNTRRKPSIDYFHLQALYINQRRNIKEISEMLKISRPTIRNALIYFGLYNQKINKDILKELYINRRWGIVKIANHFRIAPKKVLNLINEYNIPKRSLSECNKINWDNRLNKKSQKLKTNKQEKKQ